MPPIETATEIRDPIHGYIHIADVEREIIDTPVFQRLRRIKQLAGACLTYPGAVHTRFDHALGAMHLAGLAGASLSSKIELRDDDIRQLRIAAMLHDVGHGPFSHLFEEVLTEKTDLTHEDLAQRVIRETELHDILGKYGYSVDEMSGLAIGRCSSKPAFMNEVVAGGLSVDIMDYLLRDSYFTGVEYGKVDVHRVINSYEVVDDHLALDQAALYAFEALVIARYEMFKAVYFHKTVRAAEIMLVRAISLADDYFKFTDLKSLSNYLQLADDNILTMLLGIEPGKDHRLRQAKEFAIGYRDRRLLKCVFEKVVHRKDRFMERIFSQRSIREDLATEIGKEAKVDPGLIHIDVPTTTSVPYSSQRETLSSVTLVSKGPEGRQVESVNVEDLALLGAITGFIDVIRVYTPQEHRISVGKAVDSFFKKEGFITRISV